MDVSRCWTPPGSLSTPAQGSRAPCPPFLVVFRSFLDLRHVYADPAAVIFQVRQLRKFFPRSPIHAARLKRLQVVVSVLRDGVGWHAMG